VLSIEVNLDAYKFAKKNDLSTTMYHELMMDNIDEVVDKRMKALKETERYKFPKKVQNNLFQVGDIVWKTVLPLGTMSNKFYKRSPSCQGPYKVIKVIFGNSYMVETLQVDIYRGH